MNKFSIYLSLTFLGAIGSAFMFSYIPKMVCILYFGMSAVTYIAYAYDKSKAKRGVWRTKESTLHLLSVIGGWPGAALAQQFLRHKSSKRAFRLVYWFTVLFNLGCLILLYSSYGRNILALIS